MPTYTAQVTRVTGGDVYVEVPQVAAGFEFGPCLDAVTGLTVGDPVIVTSLGTDVDDFAVIARIGSHTHDQLEPPVLTATIATMTLVEDDATVPYSSVIDTHDGWDNTAHDYTIPTTGIYRISFVYKVYYPSGSPAHTIRRNGAPAYVQPAVAVPPFGGAMFTWTARLTAGDTVDVYLFQNGYQTMDDGPGVDTNTLTIEYLRA